MRQLVEDAPVDQPQGRGHQREFPAKDAAQIIRIHLRPVDDVGKRMDEDIEAEIGGGLPERLQVLAVERLALQLGGDDDAGEAKVDGAALQLRRRFRAIERRHMGEADEAAGMLQLDLAQAVIDELALAHIRLVEAGAAGEHAGVDARAIHHAHEGADIGEQGIEEVVGIAVLVELNGHPGRIALLQFRRGVVRLKIDDHSVLPGAPSVGRAGHLIDLRRFREACAWLPAMWDRRG